MLTREGPPWSFAVCKGSTVDCVQMQEEPNARNSETQTAFRDRISDVTCRVPSRHDVGPVDYRLDKRHRSMRRKAVRHWALDEELGMQVLGSSCGTRVSSMHAAVKGRALLRNYGQ